MSTKKSTIRYHKNISTTVFCEPNYDETRKRVTKMHRKFFKFVKKVVSYLI